MKSTPHQKVEYLASISEMPKKFNFAKFKLLLPLNLIKDSSLNKDTKVAIIYAYSVLNHLKSDSLFVSNNKFVKFDHKVSQNNKLNYKFFRKCLQALKVSNSKIYDYSKALSASLYVRNSKNDDFYLATEKYFHFPELNSENSNIITEDRFTHCVTIDKEEEIHGFGKANNVNMYFIRALHSEPFSVERDYKEIIPLSYDKVLNTLGLSNRNIINKTGEFFNLKKVNKYIEITKSEYDIAMSRGNDGFYTALKVVSPVYAKAISNLLIKKSDKLLTAGGSFVNRYFRFEGYRYITNVKVNSVALLVKSNFRNHLKKKIKNTKARYNYIKSSKLIVHDKILQPSNTDYKTMCTNNVQDIRVLTKSRRNSLYSKYNEINLDATEMNVEELSTKFSWNIVSQGSFVKSVQLLRTAVTQNILRGLLHVADKVVKYSENRFTTHTVEGLLGGTGISTNFTYEEFKEESKLIKKESLNFSRYRVDTLDKLSIKMVDVINNFTDKLKDNSDYSNIIHLIEALKIELYTSKSLPHDVYQRAVLFELKEMMIGRYTPDELKRKRPILKNKRFVKVCRSTLVS